MSGELVSTRKPNLTMEGVELLNGQFRNFGGKPTKFNPDGGKRTFAVRLDPEVAEAMKADGWNVKWLEPRDQDDERVYFLKVNIKYGKGRPPRVVMVTSRGRTQLPEPNDEIDMVAMIDWVDIANVDMIIRPYNYDVNGSQGISAYLQSIYITIAEDDLERKYANVPELTAPLQLEAAQEEDFIDGEAEWIDEVED